MGPISWCSIFQINYYSTTKASGLVEGPDRSAHPYIIHSASYDRQRQLLHKLWNYATAKRPTLKKLCAG